MVHSRRPCLDCNSISNSSILMRQRNKPSKSRRMSLSWPSSMPPIVSTAQLLLVLLTSGMAMAQDAYRTEYMYAQEGSSSRDTPPQPSLSSSLCQICPTPGETIRPTNDRELSIVGQNRIRSCASMAASVELFPVLDDTELCNVFRNYAFYCGCPTFPDDYCRLCPNPNHTISFSFRSTPIFNDLLFGGAESTCGTVESAAATLSDSNVQCQQLQTATSDYCGCAEGRVGDDGQTGDNPGQGHATFFPVPAPSPVAPIFGESPSESLPSFSPYPSGGEGIFREDPNGDRMSCFLCGTVPFRVTSNRKLPLGILPVESCVWLSEALNLLYRQGDAVCQTYQQFGSLCGCPVPNDACHLCDNGGNITLPERILPSNRIDKKEEEETNDQRENKFQKSVQLTCELYGALTETTLSTANDTCHFHRFFGNAYCNCDPPSPQEPDPCRFCPDSPVPDSHMDKELPALADAIWFTPTCGTLQELGPWLKRDSALCNGIDFTNVACGCASPPAVLGADSRTEQRGIEWTRRGFAILSILCCCLVIVHTMNREERRSKVYHQLVFRMALYDLFFNCAWVVVNSDDPNSLEDYDNDYSCQAHSFFVHSWVLVCFAKATLLSYYTLVLSYGYNEDRLLSVRFWMRAVPLSTGLTFISSAIPFYPIFPFACYYDPIIQTDGGRINDYQDSIESPQIILFTLVPFVLSMLVSIGAVLLTVLYRRNGTSFSALSNRNNNISNETTVVSAATRQSVLYLLVMVLSWPMFVVGIVVFTDSAVREGSFGFWLVVMATGPLHGIGNCIVYFIPYVGKHLQDKGWIRKDQHHVKKDKQLCDNNNNQSTRPNSRSMEHHHRFVGTTGNSPNDGTSNVAVPPDGSGALSVSSRARIEPTEGFPPPAIEAGMVALEEAGLSKESILEPTLLNRDDERTFVDPSVAIAALVRSNNRNGDGHVNSNSSSGNGRDYHRQMVPPDPQRILFDEGFHPEHQLSPIPQSHIQAEPSSHQDQQQRWVPSPTANPEEDHTPDRSRPIHKMTTNTTSDNDFVDNDDQHSAVQVERVDHYESFVNESVSVTQHSGVASLAHLQETTSSHDEDNNSVGAILVEEIDDCDIDDYNKTGVPLAIAERDLQDDEIHNDTNSNVVRDLEESETKPIGSKEPRERVSSGKDALKAASLSTKATTGSQVFDKTDETDKEE